MKRNKKMAVKTRASGFSLAKKYLFESRNYVYFAVSLFVLSGLVAFFQPSSFTFLDSLLREIVDKTQGLSTPGLIWFIFTNNVSSAFFALFSGILFGVAPLSNALLNGAVLGYVIAKASTVTSFLEILFRLLPHGIFELPAIFIGIGLGIKLGWTIFGTYFSFYSKKTRMRQTGAWIVSLSVISLFLLISSAQIFSNSVDSSSPVPVAFFIISFLVLIVFIVWLVMLLFGEDKLRRLQLENFKNRLTGSFYVFIYVIVPLLIVAAIIEGLLISYL